MVDHGLLYRELRCFASALTGDFDVAEALQQLSLSTAQALDVAGAGVTLWMPNAGTKYITATDPVTMHVEIRQDELRQGVCVDSIRLRQVVAVNDLSVDERWPQYRPVVVGAGFSAVAGIPMLFQGDAIGAINLYDNASRAWTTDEFAAGGMVADVAVGYLVSERLRHDAEALATQLQHALDSRIVIEQAKGILAERHDLTPDAAFALLRACARTHRVKLRPLAQGIVEGTMDPIAERPAAGAFGA